MQRIVLVDAGYFLFGINRPLSLKKCLISVGKSEHCFSAKGGWTQATAPRRQKPWDEKYRSGEKAGMDQEFDIGAAGVVNFREAGTNAAHVAFLKETKTPLAGDGTRDADVEKTRKAAGRAER